MIQIVSQASSSNSKFSNYCNPTSKRPQHVMFQQKPKRPLTSGGVTYDPRRVSDICPCLPRAPAQKHRLVAVRGQGTWASSLLAQQPIHNHHLLDRTDMPSL